jgi:hypothetical protein
MTSRTARALPLRVEGVRTIPDTCVLGLHGVPGEARTFPVDAPAEALPEGAAFAIRFVDGGGEPRRALCIVDEVHAGHDGGERCTLRLVAEPAPASGRAHARTPVVVELMAVRVESGAQRVPIMIVDVAPGGLGFASFVALRQGEFIALEAPDGSDGRLLVQVVRVDREGEMWGYGAAFGDLQRAEPLVLQLLAAAAREAA